MNIPDPVMEGLRGLVLIASGGCPHVHAPDIVVRAHRAPTVLHTTLTMQDLARFKTESDLPLQMHELTHVETGGLMRGDIKIRYDVDIESIPSAGQSGQSCSYYKAITVSLILNPQVYIAREYAPGTCWFRQIREHEESHVDMDQNVIHKYAARIQDGLKLAFAAEHSYMTAPYPQSMRNEAETLMGGDVVATVNVIVRDMKRERMEKQSAVDSFAGYAYIMDQCYAGDNVLMVPPVNGGSSE